ncbi:hypothetical protein OZX73_05475 [Bifidobacterium sp. ESL0775]|uniref:hypothetical protein n=1 Tax=Bifidobacterium sp. ESL0775 TaxID=2983230 RepID=UPI0023F78D0B|nr:hypothetical protein [Bifidobacterium sp. ESL0775]WEV68743.1 hypothetical protein OZX73_05475 [Bifidobacterium sp. ESL0775]
MSRKNTAITSQEASRLTFGTKQISGHDFYDCGDVDNVLDHRIVPTLKAFENGSLTPEYRKWLQDTKAAKTDPAKSRRVALVCLVGGSVSAVVMCVSIIWLVAGIGEGTLGLQQFAAVLVTIPLTVFLLDKWNELSTGEDWRDSRISSLETTCIALADANKKLQNRLSSATKEDEKDVK